MLNKKEKQLVKEYAKKLISNRKLNESNNNSPALSVVFKDTKQYEYAVLQFGGNEGYSDFYADGENREFRTLSFNVDDEQAANELEKLLTDELEEIGFKGYHFEYVD